MKNLFTQTFQIEHSSLFVMYTKCMLSRSESWVGHSVQKNMAHLLHITYFKWPARITTMLLFWEIKLLAVYCHSLLVRFNGLIMIKYSKVLSVFVMLLYKFKHKISLTAQGVSCLSLGTVYEHVAKKRGWAWINQKVAEVKRIPLDSPTQTEFSLTQFFNILKIYFRDCKILYKLESKCPYSNKKKNKKNKKKNPFMSSPRQHLIAGIAFNMQKVRFYPQLWISGIIKPCYWTI